MNKKQLTETLKYYLEHDINALPFYMGKNEEGKWKHDISRWKKYQTEQITEEGIEAMIIERTPHLGKLPNGVAIVTGKTSGNLCCLDIDLKNRSEDDKRNGWFSREKALLSLKNVCEDFFEELYIEETKSGGLHVFYRTLEPMKKTVDLFARSEAGSTLVEGLNSKLVFTYPTEGYDLIQGSIEEIPVLTDDQLADLIIWARHWNKYKEPEKKSKLKTKGRGKSSDQIFEKTPWEQFNEEKSPLDIAKDHGWEIYEDRGDKIVLTRPGGDVTNRKSAVYEKDTDTLWVLTTSVPELEQYQAYDAFGLYAALEYEGDQTKAWKPLEKQGYGKRNPNIKPRDDQESVWAIFYNHLCFEHGIVKNEMSGELEANGLILDEETLNSHFIDIKEKYSKKKGVIPQNFWLFLKSNEVPSYHPVKEFLSANQRSSSESQIERLQACIEPFDEFSMVLLRKWLIGIVANLFEPRNPNIIGPVLYGPPNTGKTTFFERLLPEEFRDFFTIQDAEDKLDHNDAKSKLTQNLLILFDEFRFAKKVDARQFRAFISASILDYREPYARKSKKRRRIASWCAATNYPDFINEAENNRRMVPILVEAIKHDLYNSIDKKELFLEVYECYKKGETHLLTQKEVDELAKRSKDNEPVTVEEELITKFLKPGQPGEVGVLKMTATDVLEFIQRNAGSLKMPYANARTIGRLLSNLGFELRRARIDGHVHRIYHVHEKGNTSLWDDDETIPGESAGEQDQEASEDDLPF